MVFDGVRNCVPAGYYQYPPAAWRPDPEEQRILAQRLGNRMRPKFTLDVQGAIGLMGDAPAPVMSPALLALAGYRQNYAPWFGLQLRGGLLLGVATYSHSSSDNSYYGSENSGPSQTSMFGGIVEAVPLFGPFGRFLVGPLLWAGYLSFADSMLYSGSESVGLRSGTTTGFGGEFGFVLGDRERTVLSFVLRASALNTVTIFMSAGIGFHI